VHHKKSLVLLTDFFPFGIYEPYLKHEMQFLPAHFERILLLTTVSKGKQSLYDLPVNVSASHLDAHLDFVDKLMSSRFLLSKIFREEWRIVQKEYKLKRDVRIIRIMLSYLQTARKLKKQLEMQLSRMNLDSSELILYSFWNDYRSIAIAWLAQELGVPAVTRAHGWDVYFERHQPPYLPFRTFLAEHLAGCFFVSEDGKNYTAARLGITGHSRLRVARLGTVFFALNPAAEGQEFVIVSCSRMIPLKRVHLIADVLQYLTFPVRWIHFGSGYAREETERHIRQVLRDRTNIKAEMRGEISNEDLYAFYAHQHVDLFMLTSEYEGMPMVIMEAMSFGIPVMATRVGGIGEMVDDKNGFLIPKDFDPKEAAGRIAGYRQLSAAQRQGYRTAAFETWKEKFDASKNYPRFAEELLTATRDDRATPKISA
jgi:glycosyltransferase involved in cell wall biosynthesis